MRYCMCGLGGWVGGWVGLPTTGMSARMMRRVSSQHLVSPNLVTAVCFSYRVGGWVGGWVVEKVEKRAVGMSYCKLRVGWVGGWVGYLGDGWVGVVEVDSRMAPLLETKTGAVRPPGGWGGWVGGWVGGWMGGWDACPIAALSNRLVLLYLLNHPPTYLKTQSHPPKQLNKGWKKKERNPIGQKERFLRTHREYVRGWVGGWISLLFLLLLLLLLLLLRRPPVAWIERVSE